jgi:hypothetical protein
MVQQYFPLKYSVVKGSSPATLVGTVREYLASHYPILSLLDFVFKVSLCLPPVVQLSEGATLKGTNFGKVQL